MHPIRRTPIPAALLVASLLASLPAAAQRQGAPLRNLADLSLEQLSDLPVATVGKRLQRLEDVAAGVHVIRAEDIRRSGAATLAEALRLAPNLFVARADAVQYAISTAPGGSDLLANKLLVQVDGRTVYSPLFSGVFWEALEIMVEDIERIEVLSGSGGTLYGSNAVNGVINVVTRPAQSTQGPLVRLDAGRHQDVQALRWGTQVGDTPVRLHARRTQAELGVPPSSSLVRKAERMQLGFRADRRDGPRQLTLQGEVFDHRLQEPARERRYDGFHLLGRLVDDDPDGARSQWQGYIDRVVREREGILGNTTDTLDLEYQRQWQPGARHELLWGAGLRLHRDRSDSPAGSPTSLVPADRSLSLANVFVQDDLHLGRDLTLTAGLKAERNSYTGLEWLPSLRLRWRFAPTELAWVSVSRAVRTPARVDRDVLSLPFLVPSPGFEAEVSHIHEIGWRGQPAPGLQVSATAFHHDLSRQRSFNPAPGGGTFNNHYEGRTQGLTGSAQWRAHDTLRFSAGLVLRRTRLAAVPGTSPAPLGSLLGNDPRHQAQLGLSWDVAPSHELDLQWRRVGALPDPAVPGYRAVDLRWGWRAARGLEVALVGRNLGREPHAQWRAGATPAVEVPRELRLSLTWQP